MKNNKKNRSVENREQNCHDEKKNEKNVQNNRYQNEQKNQRDENTSK
ncbi:MAG: hypothetical protein RSD88_01680 [Anaerovoracaceae bacterium]